MFDVPIGTYRDLEVVHRHGDTLVLRACADDGAPVVIKTHAHPWPTDETRARLRREYLSTAAVVHPHLVGARELVDEPRRAALVLDRAGGRSFADVLADQPGEPMLDVGDLVRTAIDVGGAASALHVAGLVHGAIDADHVEISPAGAVLVDLYDACEIGAVPRRHATGRHRAPETTGRLGPADPAADQFALSRMVDTSAADLGLELPDAVRAVLDRAARPDPTDRYRSMRGFVADLRRCLDEPVGAFELGEHDVGLAWRPHDGMIDREHVLARVLAVVEEAGDVRSSRVVLLRGAEGAGRSTLLSCLADELAGRGIVAGLGRFDPSGADPPLRAPIRAMRDIVEQILASPESVADAVRTDLADRLGDDVALAVQILPSLGHLLTDAAPRPDESASADLLGRVQHAVLTTIGTISRHLVPLVLLLDDADRADDASMRALRLLRRPEQLGAAVTVLVVGDDTGPELADTLERVADAGVPVVDVTVPPLDASEIAAMLAGGTGDRRTDFASLADAVRQRTGGRPGLVRDDIAALVDDGELRLDHATGRWRWSRVALRRTEVTAGAESAQRRLDELDPDTRDVVMAAALCERAATVDVLANALGADAPTIGVRLDRALDARLLVHRTGIDERTVVACADGGVREAAVELLDHDRRSELAAALGRAMATAGVADGWDEPMSSERRFEAVRLMSHGLPHLTDPGDRLRFVELASDTARAAHRSSGYHVALELQLRAIEALGAQGWAERRALTFELHLHAAEHALMLGRTALVDELVDAVGAHDPSPLQRVELLRVQSARWWTRQDPAEGLAEARALLRELGEPLPDRPTWADVALELVATRRELFRVDPESFLDSPPVTDERLRAVSETMVRSVHLAYVSDPITNVMLALRGTRLTARDGVTEGSAYFLTSYAMLACAFGRDVDRALRFGDVGMQLARRAGGGIETMVVFASNAFVRHWGAPLADTIEPLMSRFESAIVARQRGYGLTGATFGVLHALLAGRPLHTVTAMADECAAEFDRLGEDAFGSRIAVVAQAVDDLRTGYDGSPVDGDRFASTEWFAGRPRHNEKALIVRTLQALVAACHDDRAGIREATRAAAPMLRTAPGQAIVAMHWYLSGLAATDSLATATGRRERTGRRVQAERARRWLQGWEPYAPANVAHRRALLDAAIADATGAVDDAVHRYERAVQLAQHHDSLLDIGLAAQRAAGFHARQPRSTLVDHYAQIAHDAWQAWGALAVAGALVQRLPAATFGLVPSTAWQRARQPASKVARVEEPRPSSDDTLARASRLMGQELEVHDFLERLVEILVNHTAADRGFLVLQSAEGPVVEAAAVRAREGVAAVHLASAALADHPDLCVPALNYTFRTRETLSVVDPAHDHRFRADEQLRKRNPRAMLCLPVGRASGTSGVLALESDTFTHAFEPASIEALTVLSTQAISAVENARLTSDVGSLADDVALLRTRAATLTTQAETDPLTGVSNRLGLAAAFQSEMRRATDTEAGGARRVGVLFCDLDEFKVVNDRHGHAAGDAVLREVADRLRLAVRADDIVARVGGDEFVVVSFDLPTDELDAVSERALAELRRPFELPGGVRIVLSTSIGVTEASLDGLGDGDDMDAVLRIADQAMYRAKNAGKDQIARS